GMAGCGLCGEQPFQCGDALVEVGLQAGLDAVGQVFQEAASGVEGDAVMEGCCVVCLVAGQGGGQRGRAEVAVEEGGGAGGGGVGECGVAPVDDAGDCLSGRADQDMLDSQIVVGEHQAVVGLGRRGGQERLDGPAPGGGDFLDDGGVVLGGFVSPLSHRHLVR